MFVWNKKNKIKVKKIYEIHTDAANGSILPLDDVWSLIKVRYLLLKKKQGFNSQS